MWPFRVLKTPVDQGHLSMAYENQKKLSGPGTVPFLVLMLKENGKIIKGGDREREGDEEREDEDREICLLIAYLSFIYPSPIVCLFIYCLLI